MRRAPKPLFKGEETKASGTASLHGQPHTVTVVGSGSRSPSPDSPPPLEGLHGNELHATGPVPAALTCLMSAGPWRGPATSSPAQQVLSRKGPGARRCCVYTDSNKQTPVCIQFPTSASSPTGHEREENPLENSHCLSSC